MKSRISIAMATYNGAKYLEDQLASLGRQAMPPLELVVCDDGSTDQTLDIVEEFARSAPFPVIIVRNEKNLGYADNFLKAASLCQGEQIAFCDQDDVWHPDKLAIAQVAFEDESVTLFSHGWRLISGTGKPLSGEEREMPTGVYDLKELDPIGVFLGYSCVFRRRILSLWDQEKRPIDLIYNGMPLAHDRWVYFLATATGRVAYDVRPLVLYRQHADNYVGSEVFRKKNIPQLLRDVRYKYNTYLYKRAEISRVMSAITHDLAERHEAFLPEYLVHEYDDMHQYYETRLTLFQKFRPFAVFTILKLKLSGFYDVARRYSSRRTFLEDLVAILIARRVIATAPGS